MTRAHDPRRLLTTLGNWMPGVDVYLESVRGNIQELVTRSERWPGGIEYSVRVNDVTVWYYRHEWAAREESGSERVRAIARHQEEISGWVWAEFGKVN